jgi:hypothetical protein
MMVNMLLPRGEAQNIESILDSLENASRRPFMDETKAFIAALSSALLADTAAKRFPDIQALGYWTRPSMIERLERDFRAATPQRVVRAARGMVFHMPPANVDTLFVYSWLLSLLAGNSNIIRHSSRRSAQGELLLAILDSLFAAHLSVAESNAIVSYGHEDAITAAISRDCDMRVVWGGDVTVKHIRSIALAPHATDLAFANRFSMAAINAAHYLSLNDAQRRTVAEALFNDIYWFDQMACASPRMLVWIGDGDTTEAADSLWPLLDQVAQDKGYKVEPGAPLGKVSLSYRAAIDLEVSGIRRFDERLSVITLDSFKGFDAFRSETFGGGVVCEINLPELRALAPHINYRDQTLAQFGFTDDTLREFALALKGRGLDRIVPLGRSLDFDAVWDGEDLLFRFTRAVTLKPLV